MTALVGWGNFYVIVGSSAGALIGLQFVVITLIANRPVVTDQAQAGERLRHPPLFTLELFYCSQQPPALRGTDSPAPQFFKVWWVSLRSYTKSWRLGACTCKPYTRHSLRTGYFTFCYRSLRMPQVSVGCIGISKVVIDAVILGGILGCECLRIP